MISTSELLESITHEINIIKHLAEKLTAEHLDYRPSEKQRSMLELLQYLTICAIDPATNIATGNWDHMAEMDNDSEKMTLADFPAAMDRQQEKLAKVLAQYDEEGWAKKEAKMPWGAPLKGGIAWVNMPLKCLIAYRMQLFLYLKAVGFTEIGPSNCWVGVDQKASE